MGYAERFDGDLARRDRWEELVAELARTRRLDAQHVRDLLDQAELAASQDPLGRSVVHWFDELAGLSGRRAPWPGRRSAVQTAYGIGGHAGVGRRALVSPGKRTRTMTLAAEIERGARARGDSAPAGSTTHDLATFLGLGLGLDPGQPGAASGVRLAAKADSIDPSVAPDADEELARLDRAGGDALPQDVRHGMESLFGHDFSHVRVHTDGDAAAAAASISARAFSIGPDLYFGAGAYDPATDAGKRLLVHELTHVVQHDQGRMPGPVAGGAIEVSRPSDETEREATAMEARAGDVRSGAERLADAGDAAGASQARAETPGGVASRNIIGDVVDWGADRIDDVKEWGADRLKGLVARVAPGIMELIEHGPAGLIKQALEPAIRSWVGSIVGGIKASPFGEVAQQFQTVFALLQGARAGDPKCCETLVNGINAFREIAMGFLHNPAFEMVKNVLGTISDVLGTVMKFVLSPVFDLVKEIVGGAWTAIQGVASTIWGWLKKVKDIAGRAFDWVARQLGFTGGTGEGGLLEWLKQKIGEVWSSIREVIQPVIGPLKVIAGVLVMLSPLGPIIAIVKYGPQVVEAVQWLWANRSNPNIVKDAHREMGHTFLPKLLEVGSSLVTHLQGAASWLADTVGKLATSVLELLGAVSGIPLLSLAQDFLRTLRDGVSGFKEWAEHAFHNAGQWLGDVYKTTANFIRPYKEVLCSIGLCVVNPAMIPVVLAGWAWEWLPDCIKPPIIDLFLDIVLAAIDAIPVLPMFGLLWPMLKPAAMGFLRGVRAQTPEAKIKVTNKLAKIIRGSSPEFLFGFVKGFLHGVWDNVIMPFQIIWGMATGLTKVVDYFSRLADEAAAPPQASPAAPAPAASGQSPPPRSPPPPPPTDLSYDTIYSRVSQYSDGLAASNPPAVGPASGASSAAASPGSPDLAAEAKRIGDDLAGPVDTVKTGFWPAVQSVFTSGAVSTLSDLIDKLGMVWEAAKTGIEKMAFDLAGKIFQFFMGDGAEETLGETIGYLVGMVAFQLVLDYFTVGAGAAIPVLAQIAKFLNWPMKALEEVMGLLKILGRYIIDGVKAVGEMLAKSAPVRIVVDAFREIGEKLMAHADDLLARFGGKAAGAEARAAEAEAARTAEGQAARRAEGEAAAAREGDEAAAASKAEGRAAEREAVKAAELAEVEAIVQSIRRSAQVTGIEAHLVALSLDTLRSRYRWINHFEMRPIGRHRYELYLIASEHREGPYEEHDDPIPPRDLPPAPSNTWHLTVDPPSAPFRTQREWDELIEAAASDQEAYFLRRQRYLQACEGPPRKPTMPLDDWEAQTKRLHENAARGRASEEAALSEAGIPNNNMTSTAPDGRVRRWPDPPIEGQPSCRPDGVTDRHWVDVKATNEDRIYMTEQMRLEQAGARAEGKDLAIIVVSDNAAILPSEPLRDGANVLLLKRGDQWFQWSKVADNWSPIPGPAGRL